MNAQPDPSKPQVYHHHIIKFWRQVSGISLLLVLGILAALIWRPLLALFWMPALSWLACLGFYWSWHTFSFTPDDRLICKRGFRGCTQDIVSLFGVVTPQQPPIFGKWLDVGSVQINPIGGSMRIQHIADFDAFYQRLVYGAQHQEPPSPVQIFLQVPTTTGLGAGWPVELPLKRRPHTIEHRPGPGPRDSVPPPISDP